MTSRLPMFLAAFLGLASHAAYASSTPTNTDEIRALIASREPASPPLLTATPKIEGLTRNPASFDPKTGKGHRPLISFAFRLTLKRGRAC